MYNLIISKTQELIYMDFVDDKKKTILILRENQGNIHKIDKSAIPLMEFKASLPKGSFVIKLSILLNKKQIVPKLFIKIANLDKELIGLKNIIKEHLNGI